MIQTRRSLAYAKALRAALALVDPRGGSADRQRDRDDVQLVLGIGRVPRDVDGEERVLSEHHLLRAMKLRQHLDGVRRRDERGRARHAHRSQRCGGGRRVRHPLRVVVTNRERARAPIARTAPRCLQPSSVVPFDRAVKTSGRVNERPGVRPAATPRALAGEAPPPQTAPYRERSAPGRSAADRPDAAVVDFRPGQHWPATSIRFSPGESSTFDHRATWSSTCCVPSAIARLCWELGLVAVRIHLDLRRPLGSRREALARQVNERVVAPVRLVPVERVLPDLAIAIVATSPLSLIPRTLPLVTRRRGGVEHLPDGFAPHPWARAEDSPVRLVE